MSARRVPPAVPPGVPRGQDDIAFDLDGRPLPITPTDVRAHILRMLDEGDVLAIVVRHGGDLGVQVLGPPSLALVELLEQAVAGLRRATEGH